MRYAIILACLVVGCKDDCCRGESTEAVKVRVAMAYASTKAKLKSCDCGNGGRCVCPVGECRCPDCPTNCSCRPAKPQAVYAPPMAFAPSFSGGACSGGG